MSSLIRHRQHRLTYCPCPVDQVCQTLHPILSLLSIHLDGHSLRPSSHPTTKHQYLKSSYNMGNPSFCNCVAAKVDHKFDPTTAGQAKAVVSPDPAGISGAPVSPVSGADASVDGASADYAGGNEASISCYLPPCCVRLILLPQVVV